MDSYSKRLEKARKAFQHGDENASALAHDPALIAKAAEEHGGAGSQYLGEMVYGGLDGIIPGGTFLNNPDDGLERFINSVSDIKLFFQTYSYPGN